MWVTEGGFALSDDRSLLYAWKLAKRILGPEKCVDTNPYSASDTVDDLPVRRVPGHRLLSASLIISLMAGLGLSDTGASANFFWLALLGGLPILSFMAGHARRRDRVATVMAGVLVAIAGIIAFLPICIGVGSAVGMGIHSRVDPLVGLAVCTGSVGAACAVVVGLHHLRGEDGTNAENVVKKSSSDGTDPAGSQVNDGESAKSV